MTVAWLCWKWVDSTSNLKKETGKNKKHRYAIDWAWHCIFVDIHGTHNSILHLNLVTLISTSFRTYTRWKKLITEAPLGLGMLTILLSSVQMPWSWNRGRRDLHCTAHGPWPALSLHSVVLPEHLIEIPSKQSVRERSHSLEAWRYCQRETAS